MRKPHSKCFDHAANHIKGTIDPLSLPCGLTCVCSLSSSSHISGGKTSWRVAAHWPHLMNAGPDGSSRAGFQGGGGFNVNDSQADPLVISLETYEDRFKTGESGGRGG